MHTQTPKIEKDCAEVGAQSTISPQEFQTLLNRLDLLSYRLEALEKKEIENAQTLRAAKRGFGAIAEEWAPRIPRKN
jgi:hypothetical protein